MKIKDISNQIKEAQELINKLEKILISIHVDAEYLQEEINLNEIKECLFYVANKDYNWNPDPNIDLTYKDNPDKREAYFNGVKEGFASSLFWMAEFFGSSMVDFFEDEIGHNFENLKNE